MSIPCATNPAPQPAVSKSGQGNGSDRLMPLKRHKAQAMTFTMKNAMKCIANEARSL
jgi:hypothetical protein